MKAFRRIGGFPLASGSGLLVVATFMMGGLVTLRPAWAAFPRVVKRHHHVPGAALCRTCYPNVGEGAWYWMRSPEQERQVVMSAYARYCVRCHGIDGRGVWDIPGVPNFTDARWQACRPDGALARSIIEGRGAVMPPFRGTLTLEESWAMARYLRTFVPGTEASKPDLDTPTPTPAAGGAARPPANGTPTPDPSAPPAAATSRGAFRR